MIRVNPHGDIDRARRRVSRASGSTARTTSCTDRDGTLYFTDPPFGLPDVFDDPHKELPFSGVFRVDGRRRWSW